MPFTRDYKDLPTWHRSSRRMRANSHAWRAWRAWWKSAHLAAISAMSAAPYARAGHAVGAHGIRRASGRLRNPR